MAVNAGIFYSDGYFALDLYPGEDRERIEGDPPGVLFDQQSPWIFEWDGEKLDRGEHEILGLTVFHLERLTEDDFRNLERLSLPRVSCPEAGLLDVEVATAVRWAMNTYRAPGNHTLGWPTAARR